MAEKLTKTALKNELNRRAEWFEANFGFHSNRGVNEKDSPNILMMYGRYLALREMKYQIEHGMFVDGFAC